MVFWVPLIAYAAAVLLAALSFARKPAPRRPLDLARALLRYLNEG